MAADIRSLVEALADLDLDDAEIAEAVWLARVIRDGPAPAAGGDEPARPAPAPRPEPPDGAAGSAPPAGSVPVGRFVPPDEGTVPAGFPRLPSPPALPGGTRMLAELRPLARPGPDPGRRVFDEDASVERSAHTAVTWPVTRAAAVRDREVALVLDRHPSMAAWEGLADEVRTLLAALGGFRRVTTWFLDEDAAGGLRLADGPRAPANRPISVLHDPGGRRIILLLTTALGDAWAWGTAPAQLAALAAASPVALAQPLPAALWRRTGMDWRSGRVAAVVPGRPGALQTVGADGADVLPVPVLELAPGWFGSWAGLLAGDVPQARLPLLRRVRPAEPHERRTLAQRQDTELGDDPAARVRRFRAVSSPEAFRLAASLSVVPLNLPIMRLIQQVALPGTGGSALAEVIAGGLLEAAGARDAPPYSVPEDERDFGFRPGVKEVLRQAVRRSEVRDILANVSTFMADRYDVPARLFRTTVSRPAAPADGHHFGYISPQTLRRIAPSFPGIASIDLDPGFDDSDRYDVAIRETAAARDHQDIGRALSACRGALSALPVGDRRRGGLLDRTVELLNRRWSLEGDPADLDEAIALAKAGLADGAETDRVERLTVLSRILLLRSGLGRAAGRNRPDDLLTEAVRVLQAAVNAVPADDPRRAGQLELLADATVVRAEATGDPVYGWDAVDLYHTALRLGAAERDRTGVLLLKSVRALVDVLAGTVRPDERVAERVLDELRRALRTGPPDEDFGRALSDAAARIARIGDGGRLRAGAVGVLGRALDALPAADPAEPVLRRAVADLEAADPGTGEA
jgi:hypothetical protein